MSRLIFWVLLGTVLLLPVTYGSIYPSAYTIFAVLVAVMVGVWSLTIAVTGAGLSVPVGRVWISLALFGIVIARALVQTGRPDLLVLERLQALAATRAAAAQRGQPVSPDRDGN